MAMKKNIDKDKDNLDGFELALGIKIFYKNILLPISVAYGDYCWGYGRICGHFNNEGGHPRCEMGIADLKCDKENNVPKPKKCKELEEA